MSESFIIRQASSVEAAQFVAIDDDACARYDSVGLHFGIAPDHPFARAERACWNRCAERGQVYLADAAGAGAPLSVGLLVMDRLDGQPYLEQLSVRVAAQGQGLGRSLLLRAIDWAGSEPLWLTTYAHVAWNRPFYQRHGFVPVPESRCAPEILAALAEQRRWLPAPEQRIVMRRAPSV